MKIFILEDDKNRIEWFMDEFNGNNITWIDNAYEAKPIILFEKFDIIFLDHDLGGKIYQDSKEENCGFQIAKIINDGVNLTTPIIIHSLNYPAAQNMKNEIKINHKAQTETIPFNVLTKKVIKYE